MTRNLSNLFFTITQRQFFNDIFEFFFDGFLFRYKYFFNFASFLQGFFIDKTKNPNYFSDGLSFDFGTSSFSYYDFVEFSEAFFFFFFLQSLFILECNDFIYAYFSTEFFNCLVFFFDFLCIEEILFYIFFHFDGQADLKDFIISDSFFSVDFSNFKFKLYFNFVFFSFHS
jgi:hypothetical protein